jgi:hypothetical protein
MTHNEQFLTVGELLDRWKMDPRTLDKMVKIQGLVYVELLPRKRLFPLSAVVSFERANLRVSSTA